MSKKKPFKNYIIIMHTPAQKFQCHNCLRVSCLKHFPLQQICILILSQLVIFTVL